MSSGAAGVGSTPPSRTSPPAALAPAATAASSISPDSRGSRMIRTRGRSVPVWATAARARASASSAVTCSPATPRTPSVPNRWRGTLTRLSATQSRGAAPPRLPRSGARHSLPLRELRALARLLEAGLLALLDPRVAGEEAAPLQLAAQVGVREDQRARDAV